MHQTQDDLESVEVNTSASGKEKLAAAASVLFIVIMVFAIIWDADSRSAVHSSKERPVSVGIAIPNSQAKLLDGLAKEEPNSGAPQKANISPDSAAVDASKSTNIEPRTWLGLNDADIKFLSMLIASVFGAWVAYLGHRFNLDHNKRSHTLQIQSEKRLAAEADRTAEARTAELQNQKTETLVKWVQLLGGGEQLAHVDQRIAASLVLAKSGMVEIALTYLDSVWRKPSENPDDKGLDVGCAVAVINEGLASENEALQDLAAMTLEYHATKLSIGQENKLDYFWPNVVEWRWKQGLSIYARLAIWQALVNALLTHKFDAWDQVTVRGAFVTLHAAMTQDTSSVVKYASAKVARSILDRFDTLEVLLTSEQKYCLRQVVLAEIDTELAKPHDPLPTAVCKLLEQVLAWCNEKPPTENVTAKEEMKAPENV